MKGCLTLWMFYQIGFWTILWTHFLSFLAGIIGLRAEALLSVLGITAYSSIPIALFGATGGAIGGWISHVYDQKFAVQR